MLVKKRLNPKKKIEIITNEERFRDCRGAGLPTHEDGAWERWSPKPARRQDVQSSATLLNPFSASRSRWKKNKINLKKCPFSAQGLLPAAWLQKAKEHRCLQSSPVCTSAADLCFAGRWKFSPSFGFPSRARRQVPGFLSTCPLLRETVSPSEAAVRKHPRVSRRPSQQLRQVAGRLAGGGC